MRELIRLYAPDLIEQLASQIQHGSRVALGS